MMKRSTIFPLLCLLLFLPLRLLAIPAGYGKVNFFINVPDCLVFIAGKTIEGGSGQVSIYLREGSYDYQITSDRYYHIQTGNLAVVSTKETDVKVNLRPTFGSISVDAGKQEDISGAAVFVDGKIRGEIPCKVEKLLSGTHSVRVVKKNYFSGEYQITVREEKEERLSPVLKANYSIVRISTSPKAEIRVNSETLGVGEWTGKMEAGVYCIESWQPYFIPGTLEVEIKAGSGRKEFKLPAPEPQYGSLRIDFSTSLIAFEVFLDDSKVGVVPVFLEKVQAGRHTVRLEKKSGASVKKYRSEVDVMPGQTATIHDSQFVEYSDSAL